jgi:hypothetical protein
MLNTAIKAARGAGAIINRASLDLDLLKVNTKAPNDFVTEVDTKAEGLIIETLLGAYPGHGILAEESGRAHGAKDSEFVWIIDPLDGTTNFIHGFPVYSVSIALAFRGQVQQAVVYDPTRNDLFYASKGRGAFLNDRRLRVSKRVRLAECLIGNFTGESDYLYQREIVAGSPKIYGQLVAMLGPFSRVIAPDAPAGADTSTLGLTPEDALAAGVAIERDPDAATKAAAPVKKPATRITKESMAREKQAAADAERKPPRARAPRGSDTPF